MMLILVLCLMDVYILFLLLILELLFRAGFELPHLDFGSSVFDFEEFNVLSFQGFLLKSFIDNTCQSSMWDLTMRCSSILGV